MPDQRRWDVAMLEERVTLLEKEVHQARATASGALGLAGVALAFAVFWLFSR